MALSDTLTLENAFNANNTFVKTKQDLTGSNYIDSASSAAEPRFLNFKHSATGKGMDAVDRHLIQFGYTKLDTENVPRLGQVNTTLVVPRSTIITPTIMYNLIANLVDFLMAGVFASSVTSLTTTNVDKIFRGEQ